MFLFVKFSYAIMLMLLSKDDYGQARQMVGVVSPAVRVWESMNEVWAFNLMLLITITSCAHAFSVIGKSDLVKCDKLYQSQDPSTMKCSNKIITVLTITDNQKATFLLQCRVCSLEMMLIDILI